jgi:hypothetical protein
VLGFIPYLVLVQVSGYRDLFCRLGPTEYVSHEDRDKNRRPRFCVLNKNRMMDNVYKCNTCINIPSSQTLDLTTIFENCLL